MMEAAPAAAPAAEEPESEPVQVFVKGLDGVTMKFDVPLSTTVEEFKIIVSKETGAPPADEIRLVYSGRQMVDDNTLSESGVSSNSTIHILLRLKGGGSKPYVSKYSRTELDKMQKDPAFRVNLMRRCADGKQGDDDEAIDLYASQCITARRNRSKTSMKQAGQPAEKKRSRIVKIKAEMAAAGLNPMEKRPRKSAAKAKAALKVEDYAAPPPDSDDDVEIVGPPKFGLLGTVSADVLDDSFPPTAAGANTIDDFISSMKLDGLSFGNPPALEAFISN